MSSHSAEYFAKRKSWNISLGSAKEQGKKRASMPTSLVRAYLAQFGDIPPPPGFDPIVEEVKDDIANLPALCCSAASSRRAQSVIEKASPLQLEQVVAVLAQHLPKLMVDVYANYTCQTLFLNCSAEQRLRLIYALAPHLIDIAKDTHGTHSLQALVNLITCPAEEAVLVSAFAAHVSEVARHPAAAHVLVKLMTTCKSNSKLIQPLIGCLSSLCKDSLGLLVIKAAITGAKGKDRDLLRAKLLKSCVHLMQDAYGNYAIQHMLAVWGWNACSGVLHQVSGRLAQLSCQKFASNTVERLLELAPEQDREQLLHELLDPLKLRELLGNKFAQFVFRKALLVGGSGFREQLLAEVSSLLPTVEDKKKAKWQAIISLLGS